MDLAGFDYHLPEALIAQEALADRAGARMLVVYRQQGRWEDRAFREFPGFLGAGDCLVLNDSRVFPARLFGRRAGVASLPIGTHNPRRREYLSGQVEVFLLRPVSADGRDWEALVRPGRKMRVGERVIFERGREGGLEAEIVARGQFGERTVRFAWNGRPGLAIADLFERFEQIGHVPLPPYIKRSDEARDRERYQTVFAQAPGSVAAPTAGLHFTGEVLEACQARGAEVACVTLHVGLGTFQPLHEEQVEKAALHAEPYNIPAASAAKIRSARRVVAVGTTSVRTVESAWREGVMCGETDIFIYPGVPFRRVGAILTNFHLPRTSLLLLVCAFAGKELTLAAYRHAVEREYRFYSYGDCMLIL
ncbi:MAG TPA: tRNA preQ1(34) S-adenosylmethionine ribosyltransferase-isomerase QueA [Candidatus Acidoferrales bacterium]|nr:tRNA preQ1(34) S-adenosylmethionine ribosyltransferase-isomerase QueA [Candidatus Acidoferrales bacterium]